MAGGARFSLGNEMGRGEVEGVERRRKKKDVGYMGGGRRRGCTCGMNALGGGREGVAGDGE